MFFLTNYFSKRKRVKESACKEIEKGHLPDMPAELHQTLGMRLEEGYPLLNRLNDAWNEANSESVRERLTGKGIISSEAYGWYELELKRFFYLSAIMKNVPMYNGKVDAVWHDMILFTKEYADFCEQFNGAMIHHAPTDKPSKTKASASHERALYELVYSILFDSHPGSELIQGAFGNCLLDKPFMLRCEQLSGQALERYIRDALFKQDSSRHDHLIRAASEKVAYHVTEAKERIERSGADSRKPMGSLSGNEQAVHWLLYTSMTKAHKPEAKEKNSAASPGSSCTGYGGHRHDRDDPHHDSDDASSCSGGSGESSSSSCSSSSCGGCSS